MYEVGVRPGKVGLEERRTDGDSGWVVRRLGRIDDSYDCLVERLVEDGKVCGVATNTDQRFEFGEFGEVVEQVVRIVVWMGEVSGIVGKR